MRLIDADALTFDVKSLSTVSPEASNYAIAVVLAIDRAPTIDAVSVVRCKDCTESEECPVAGVNCVYCGVWDTIVRRNGYCDHHGAKMDAKEG